MGGSRQRVKHLFTKVVGVTHSNSDGTSRQRIIERCKLGEKLILDHEDDNPVDPNAVKVCRENGQQLGYLKAELAEDVVWQSNQGCRFAVFVKNITGGTREAPTRGINLLVVVAEPGVTDREAQEYADSLEAQGYEDGLIVTDAARTRRASSQQVAKPLVGPPAIDEIDSDIGRPPNYPGMRRRLSLLQLRQWVRFLCDWTGLGPSTSERLCWALIVAVIPFVFSFALSFAFRQPAGYAALQGVGAFIIVAGFLALMIGWAADDELEARKTRLLLELPEAEAAWQAYQKRLSANRETARAAIEAFEEEEPEEADGEPLPTLKKCPYCVEFIQAEARKCKHCGELLDRSLHETENRREDRVIHVHVSNKSGGTAAVLELIFGLFFLTFGIGHIYAGNVGSGLLLMFGWWSFLAIASCLGILTLGLGLILIPACWFLMIILSPIMAASSVPQR